MGNGSERVCINLNCLTGKQKIQGRHMYNAVKTLGSHLPEVFFPRLSDDLYKASLAKFLYRFGVDINGTGITCTSSTEAHLCGEVVVPCMVGEKNQR